MPLISLLYLDVIFISIFLKLEFVSPLSFQIILHEFCLDVLKHSAYQENFTLNDIPLKCTRMYYR